MLGQCFYGMVYVFCSFVCQVARSEVICAYKYEDYVICVDFLLVVYGCVFQLICCVHYFCVDSVVVLFYVVGNSFGI